MINKNTQQRSPHLMRPKPTTQKIPPKIFNQTTKIQKKEKKDTLPWDLKNAGEAILIASGILILQIILMFIFNLKLKGSLILGFFLFVIYCGIIYLLLFNENFKTKLEGLKRFK
jgi:hypothetical protein